MKDNEFLKTLVSTACKDINDLDYIITTFGNMLDMLANGEMDAQGICQMIEMLKNSEGAFEESALLTFLGRNVEKTSDAILYNTGYILEAIYYNLGACTDPKIIEKIVLEEYGESSPHYISFFLNSSKEHDRDITEDDDNFNENPAADIDAYQTTSVTFDDVAGVDSVKAELEEVVDFLKYPEKYTKLGAKMPKGVLLTGLPGTGKTLLAKAVAGEAGVAFLPMAGSEFVEQYVGVGAKRVRELFEEARSYGSCIIFIDEIDALAKKRGGVSNGESDQTVNQLLTEMDGFASGDDNILVIAATNHESLLDSAVLRPGRFDRIVHLDLPDINGREAILKVHSKSKPLDDMVNLRKIAEKTSGMSGADLANLLNEAAILGARRSADTISMLDIELASEKITMGLPKEKVVTEEEKILVAVHEAAHSISTWLLPTDSKVHSLTIVPRGGALGYARSVKGVEKGYKTTKEYTDDIKVALAGVVGEGLFIGEVTSGCSSDLQAANSIATAMITKFGMNGSLVVSDKADPKDTDILLSKCYNDVKEMLEAHKSEFLAIVKLLLEKETLYAEDLEGIMKTPQSEKSSYSGKINDFMELLK